MKRTPIIAVEIAASIASALFIPSIRVELFCDVQGDPTWPGIEINRGLSVVQNLVYLSGGKKLTIENGVTCHEYRGRKAEPEAFTDTRGTES